MGATDSITLNRMLTTAAGLRASDLHLLIGSQPIVRVNGQLQALADEQIISEDFMESVLSTFLTEQQRKTLETNKEIVLGYSLNPQVRFKVSAFYQRGSLAMTLHFISTELKHVKDLQLPEAVNEFVKLNKGLVLVTGPYGSGRTTTLNALINDMNESRTLNIVTIEHPIEHLFVNNQSIIEQREIGRDALSTEQAIRAANRDDVDVIVVSEAESREEITAMLDAAEASRLVISTMNTDSVLGTIEKILNSFPSTEVAKARAQLANVLAGIITQKLLPRVGGGVVPVVEVMIPTQPVRAVLRDGALVQLANVLQTSRQPGLVSFDRQLAQLVRDNVIVIEDALPHAQDPNQLKTLIR